METMNRCTLASSPRPPMRQPPVFSALRPLRRWVLVLLGSTLLLGGQALAQSETVRPFPAHALRGEMVVTQPPLVKIDGVETRLSPGSRILDTYNRVVPATQLVNQAVAVNYTRELMGMVHEVWILRPEEAALKRKRASE